jgi:hypothetical protein
MADTIEVSASATDTAILFIPIPVESKVFKVSAATDDLGTGCTMSIGLFKKDDTGNTYTAVSATCFASAIDVATAATAMTEYRFSALNIDTMNKAAWELAGLSAKPSYPNFYIGLTFNSAAAAGTVSVICTKSQ